MSKKLNFDETDLLNATWSGMKSLQAKQKKDSTDANALAKGTMAITKFMEMKMRWLQYVEKNPKASTKDTLFLSQP